jgi:hypothetical protein
LRNLTPRLTNSTPRPGINHSPYAAVLWSGPRTDGDRGTGLTLVVGTETFPAQWTTPEPPYYRASWNGETAEEPYFITNYGGKPTDLDAWMPVPIAEAREAARRFLTTGGQCPDNLTWHPTPSQTTRPREASALDAPIRLENAPGLRRLRADAARPTPTRRASITAEQARREAGRGGRPVARQRGLCALSHASPRTPQARPTKSGSPRPNPEDAEPRSRESSRAPARPLRPGASPPRTTARPRTHPAPANQERQPAAQQRKRRTKVAGKQSRASAAFAPRGKPTPNHRTPQNTPSPRQPRAAARGPAKKTHSQGRGKAVARSAAFVP